MAVRATCFIRHDANSDGMLTRAEVKKFFRPQLADRVDAAFSRLDLDRDELISREEYDRESDRLFRESDPNGDGVIAGMELGSLDSRLLGDICEPPGSSEIGEERSRPGRGGAGPGGRR